MIESQNRFRVVALDLDGTLLRSDGSTSAATLASLDRCLERGLQCVIATARPPRAVGAMLPASLRRIPWICYNGAEIYEAGQRLAQNALDPTLARDAVRILQAHAPDLTISAEIDDHLYANCPLDGGFIHEVVDLIAVLDRPAAKILFDAAAVDDVDRLCARLPNGCRAVVTDRGRLGQIVAGTVSKAWALGVLLERWSLGFDDVIAFGDDLNDLELIAASGYGVAMANASPAVKAVADLVTRSNDEDGVARVLADLLARANHVVTA